MQGTHGGHPHGAMRRKDREMHDRSEIDGIISSSKIMHLALADGNTPFVVPLFYAYDGTRLYFHSAKAGTKIEILKRNPKVCFEIMDYRGVIESEKACDFEAKHRTAIGVGTAHFVEDDAEKLKALDMIAGLFSDKKFEYPKASFDAVAVVRIEIESVKGKTHGF
jgi:nitroimidazol reductase NimA-like FMN-containing flavoprotein (pyridoxamine 5'-phosphate oxidase superfamily)